MLVWPVLAGLVASTAALVGSGLILALGDRALSGSPRCAADSARWQNAHPG